MLSKLQDMPVSAEIPAALEEEIEKEVERGGYTSKSEVIRDAVRRLIEQKNRERGRVMSEEMEEKVRAAREQKGKDSERPVSDL